MRGGRDVHDRHPMRQGGKEEEAHSAHQGSMMRSGYGRAAVNAHSHPLHPMLHPSIVLDSTSFPNASIPYRATLVRTPCMPPLRAMADTSGSAKEPAYKTLLRTPYVQVSNA
jgi:hypothetical protein